MPTALSVEIKKLISGPLRQEQAMKQKQNSSDALSANILGGSIDDYNNISNSSLEI